MVEQIEAMRDIAYNLTMPHQSKNRAAQPSAEFDPFRTTNQLLVGILAEIRALREDLNVGCKCATGRSGD